MNNYSFASTSHSDDAIRNSYQHNNMLGIESLRDLVCETFLERNRTAFSHGEVRTLLIDWEKKMYHQFNQQGLNDIRSTLKLKQYYHAYRQQPASAKLKEILAYLLI